jgi:hypothetical protein
LADAPLEIKDQVSRGMIHENTVFEILAFEEDKWLPMCRFITSIALGTKKRSEVMRMLREIAGRDQCDPLDLIESKEMRQILSSMKIDPPQRAERVYRRLKELRYPTIEEFRRRFNNKLGEVGFISGLHLTIPENFEKWEFKLALDFSSAEDFRKRVEELRCIGENPAFEDLMNTRY